MADSAPITFDTFIDEKHWTLDNAVAMTLDVVEHHLETWCPDASPEERGAAMHTAYDGTVDMHPVLRQMIERMEHRADQATGRERERAMASARMIRRNVHGVRAGFRKMARHFLRVADTRLPFLHDVIKLKAQRNGDQRTWKETHEWFMAAVKDLDMHMDRKPYNDHNQLRKKYNRWRKRR